ncbi:hypothetical protein C900_00356 [Fulvivirga imtechensis AK7]|uniref:Biopterin-dependent aromatic amino acid hydroxylase family profile domain-containing protein n=1 Tax=Fulvivirga imtechensis AK7 TaxID=1237149 RepID=L8JJN9_9BACT|nr:phenylalanine 4-monooxygenase [Fulvivirga imtechensis]ELR68463.1 hypothetical protein C900_00356 [Fulvivirga imtechensis AK7]
MITTQNYDAYTSEDHKTWSALNERLLKKNFAKTSKEYQRGFDLLDLNSDKVIKIEQISKRLEEISGWTLIPVTGLIPTRDFFYMLINKKYPINIYLRKPHELDFSEDPDIFHDILGHVPLLTNEPFCRFLTEFSIIALKYADNEKAVEFLGRLYWYTFEMGLIRENGELLPYGGAIITSTGEIENVSDNKISKYEFDINHIFNTPYDNYHLQKEYFIINSFDDLFKSLEGLEACLRANLEIPLDPTVLLDTPLAMQINTNLTNGFNNVIGFLNDIQYKFPEAISFAAGQPDEKFFDVKDHIGKFDTYIDYLEAQSSRSREEIIGHVGQYNKTKGIVNDIIVEYLKKDENIHVKPHDLLFTLGAQEAFAVIVSTLTDRDKDVILLEDPSYIGVSSFGKVFDYKMEGVRTNDEGIDIDELEKKIIDVKSRGLNTKLLYVIPDYQNPKGSTMPLEKRLELLEIAEKHNILIIEDSVYNSFTYAQKKLPTLKSLDKRKRVIYVGSFSKSLFPGLRAGLIVADQYIELPSGEVITLSDELAKVKALFTNNTPTITQAILGGILLNYNYSLSNYNKKKFENYKIKRDNIIACLGKYIGTNVDDWAVGISWNEPNGGFFIKMEVPFEVTDKDVAHCAEKFGVIFCPMYYFYLKGDVRNEIRLTFSNLTFDQIDSGIQKLAAFLKERLAGLASDAKQRVEKAELV